MNWDKFTFEYNYDARGLFSHLVQVEALREAALNLVLPPEWRQQLDKLTRVRVVYGTTALEGNPLPESEVSRQVDILDRKESDANGMKKATREQLQIRNSILAQSWVRKRFQPGATPVSMEDILKMHAMITNDSDIDHNVSGEFRKFSVTVGSEDLGGVHKGAPYERLRKLMTDYIGFINSKQVTDEHPVVRALLAHFFLVTLHPFGDGNGRISRLLEAGILFYGEYNVHGFYGLSNYFYRNERNYKLILQKCRERQPFDVTPFIEFGVRGFAEELQGINNFIKTKLNRVIYREMLVRAYNTRTAIRRRLLNSREYNLLQFLLRETEPTDPFSKEPSRQIKLSELRKAGYVEASYRKVTGRTFMRELVRLGQLGFINFTRDDTAKDWIVELNLNAIGKY